MKKLFCIIGLSGAGKSTIMDYSMKLLKRESYDSIQKLIYHTTRPPRDNEVNGKDYYFTDMDEFLEYKKNDQIIEFRNYNMSNHGEVIYYTTKEDLSYNTSMICVPSIEQLESYIKYQELHPDSFEIYVVHVLCDMKIRFFRCSDSVRVKNDDDFLEICRRMIQEKEDWKDADILLNDHLDEDHLYLFDNNDPNKFSEDVSKLVIWLKVSNGTSNTKKVMDIFK